MKLKWIQLVKIFTEQQVVVFFNPPWDKKSEEARQFAQQHYWNVISDIMVELVVRKW
jgi:tRNA G46 methylase TrmB